MQNETFMRKTFSISFLFLKKYIYIYLQRFLNNFYDINFANLHIFEIFTIRLLKIFLNT